MAALNFSANKGATATFEGSHVVIQRAYSVGGDFFDLTFDTTEETVNKLRPLGPKVVSNFQAQIEAYLKAAKALDDPANTAFQLEQDKVYALRGNDRTPLADKTVETAAQKFHQLMETPPVTPSPARSIIDRILAQFGGSSILNLLTFGPLPSLHQVTGWAAAITGPIRFGQACYNAFMGASKLESLIKAAAGVSEFVMGLSALKVGSLTFDDGLEACIVAGGLHLLSDLKDLFLWASQGKPLPEKFIWNFLLHLALVVGPTLLLTLTFSNPITAILAIAVPAAIAFISFAMANGIFKTMKWWEVVLYFVPITASIYLSTLGLTPDDVAAIAMGISVAIMALKLATKYVAKKCCTTDSSVEKPQPEPQLKTA